MTRFTNRRASYATINAAALQDPRLSLGAKGLLAVMLSFPNDWEYHLSHLSTLSKDGRDAHRSALKELVALGYVAREVSRGAAGRWDGLSYSVTDTPELPAPSENVTLTANGFSGAGQPDATNTYIDKNINKGKTVAPDEEKPSITVEIDTEEPTPPSRRKPAEAQQTALKKENDPAAELLAVWNRHRGTLPAAGVTGTRMRRLRGVAKAHGKDAPALIRDATLEVAQDPFWKQNRYGLDNLLAGDKYVQRAESHRARPGYRPQGAGSTLERAALVDDNPFFEEPLTPGGPA